MMINHVNVFDFQYEYHHSAPTNGGSSSMILHTPGQGDATNYYIERTENKSVTLSVYENGLVILSIHDYSNIYLKTNMEFRLEDDGDFHLVS